MSIEYINHCNAVRLHVTGAGNLQQTLISLDDVETETLVPLVLSAATNRFLQQLANFTQPRMKLRIETTEIDEIFTINDIYLYIKPVANSYPG